MDSPFSDIWFEHASRRKELLMLHQLRKQNGDVDDIFFPYGLVLADLPPWEVQPVLLDRHTVGSDVERTVIYVSAALDYINRKTRKLQTDAWLFYVDRDLKPVSWSHKAFVPYQYNQQVAEHRIGKILMVAKTEQAKVDKDSIPWKYTCPDGTKLSGQLRWFPPSYEQHINPFLKYNFLIVQSYSDDSYSHIRGQGIKKYIYAVANAPVGSPVAQVANPPQFFHSLPETQYESLFKKRVVTLAPKRVLSGNLPAQQIEKRLCFGLPSPDNVNEYHPRDFAQAPLSPDTGGATQIKGEVIPGNAIPSASTEGFSVGPEITKELPLNSTQVPTLQGPKDYIEIKQKEFNHCCDKAPSSGEIGDGLKINEEDAPPHFAIQVSSSGSFGRGLDLMRN
ncbi:uncharacterized protein Bfra_011479 [Botrytis fragariae]|uniref:Uncharacterized protein n=1 Tax=Botrytis fragariae TaxID=1964551 RepID=A0A8H6EKL9_9HELO|nr:uncharacterized protein Bfra_011479 [Botrytis fragariae]KAF5875716.1 hypothetical protein Bfra_011479 [Botrytis fragariae]